MAVWRQIEGWKDEVGVPKVEFSGVILDPIHSLGILLFSGKPLWLKPSPNELIRVAYRKPHFIVTRWIEGSPHVEITVTSDSLTIISLLNRNAAFLQ